MPKHKNTPDVAQHLPGEDDARRDDRGEEAMELQDQRPPKEATGLSPEEELEAYARSLEEKQSGDSEELSARIAELEAEREAAIAARQRAQADFSNYQRRAIENETRATKDGAVTVIKSLLPVLDNLDLALSQPMEQVTVAQLMDGVRMVRQELLKALEGQKLEIILPEVGDEFDPSRHQAVRRETTDDFPPNTIVTVHQIGYAYEDQVLRPSCVAVAGAPGDAEG